jgi:hypothetical protein
MASPWHGIRKCCVLWGARFTFDDEGKGLGVADEKEPEQRQLAKNRGQRTLDVLSSDFCPLVTVKGDTGTANDYHLVVFSFKTGGLLI